MAKKTVDFAKKVKSLTKVYNFYLTTNRRVMLKASDFYIPLFFGKQKKVTEFDNEYTPLLLASFLEAARNSSIKVEGKVDERLVETLHNDLVKPVYVNNFDSYWDLINSELIKNPEDPRPMVEALTMKFLNRLYGPHASEPREDKLSSYRHRVALDFQIGKLLFELNKGCEVMLKKLYEGGPQTGENKQSANLPKRLGS